MQRHLAVPILVLSLSPLALAQTPSCTKLTGVVEDATAAVIPGANILVDGGTSYTTGPEGRFEIPCVARGNHKLTITFPGFAASLLQVAAPHNGDLTFKLVAAEDTSVTVNADDGSIQTQNPGGATGMVLGAKQLPTLADDPDDLLRQLQQMAAAAGGSPSRTTISVDGFQDGSPLPPKSSIAFINVNPDLFSAEYREPPFGGGRVEVYTKPGAKNYHGALFLTNSSSWMNARNPFTTTTGALGKQRYGFELSGPVMKQGSNFSMALEHRTIDEVSVVNAVTFNGTTPTPTQYSVPRPQSLWIPNARIDWQFGPKNFFFISYSGYMNATQNAGVGGSTLREAGYSDSNSDHYIRLSNVTTFSPKVMHSARLAYEHYYQIQRAGSTAPSIQVSGFFNGGGSSVGNSSSNRHRIEWNDDLTATLKRHTIKAGFHLFYIWRNSILRNSFNGTYTFTNAAQYLANKPTLYSNVAGDPRVLVGQVRYDAFFQDDFKLRDNLNLTFGIRYFLESDPATFANFAPRAGIAWSPDKKKTWKLTSHVGVFNGQFSADETQELYRQDGRDRITSLIYNPTNFSSPFTGGTPIRSMRTLGPGLTPGTYVMAEISASKELPGGFNINVQEIVARFLTYARTRNINQPLDNNPYGVRPIMPNTNILQVQYDGTGRGHGQFFGVSNFKNKHVQFFLGALHLNLRDNTNDGTFFQPQSAYTDAGEEVRRDNQGLFQVFGNTSINLPWKLALSSNEYANSRQPFNITTGADNNGDGSFNDRPQFAAPGSVANGTTIFATRYGLLTNNGPIVNGIPQRPTRRNMGSLPWSFNLDANLQRAFKLTRNAKADHPQTITVNVRSANFINHTNVTAMGSVLGSPQFLRPVSAGTARRIEFGLRYSF